MAESLAALMHAAVVRLEAAGWNTRDAALDVEVLTRHVLGWDRARLVEHRLDGPPAGLAAALEARLARRLRHEPVAYITGTREFWGRDFHVTPAVLIPRPETEIIVEKGLQRLEPADREWRIADAGTGSGCLAVTLACERPRARVVATDVSPPALAVARSNAGAHGVGGQVRLVRTSWLAGVRGPFDAIVANPPYIPRGDRGTLPSDVVDFEPGEALFGGGDGLDAIRVLLAEAPARLKAGGWLLMEFGFGQAGSVVREVARTPGLVIDEIARDLQGHERTLIVRRRD